MSRTFVAAVSGLVCTVVSCVVANAVGAQAGPEPLVAIDVRARNNATERCFEVKALQERIAHYGEARLSRASELRLELDLDAPDSAELRVYRGSALVSRRRFDDLPATCADRRDAIALSIALALEGVIRELAPANESNTAPAAPTTSPSASSDARTAAATANASTDAAAPRESEFRADAGRTDASPRAQSLAQQPSAARPGASRDATDEADDAADDAVETTPPGDESSAALSIRLHLGARVVAAALPAPVVAGILGGELWVDRRLGVEVSALATAVDTSSLAEGRVRSRLVGGEVLGCYALALNGLAAQGCAGLLAAACQAQGRDFPRAFPAATLGWAAATARLSLAWPTEESVSLRLVMQGHANLVRPVLRVEGASKDLSPFWLGGSAGLDLVVSFD